jgi:4-diphosphocytidyl-2-C-methyl-D-erythritol kinase
VKKIKIKSYCKINLSLKVIKKMKNGYHIINSLITFCNLYDIISITESKKLNDNIIFTGKFKKGINKKSNTITKILSLLRKDKFLINQFFKINIKKNIPHGSGLGGGSSNAACLLNYLNEKMKLKLKKKYINLVANKVGSDVSIILKKKNSFLAGKKGKIVRSNKKFKLNLLVVYPNIVCSTKKVFQNNRKESSINPDNLFNSINRKNLIGFLTMEGNDLQETVIKLYPKVKKIINYIKSLNGCYFSRITGSGSACIGIFSNIKNANIAKRLIKIKYPNYWCAVSKTI